MNVFQLQRREIDQEGNLTERIFEPGAADLRPSADGESDAILKIVAGLLGVGLDEIKQRDLIARQKARTARFASIACFLAISAIGLASYAFINKEKHPSLNQWRFPKEKVLRKNWIRPKRLRTSSKIFFLFPGSSEYCRHGYRTA